MKSVDVCQNCANTRLKNNKRRDTMEPSDTMPIIHTQEVRGSSPRASPPLYKGSATHVPRKPAHNPFFHGG